MNALVIIEAQDLTPAIFSDRDAIDKIVSDIEVKVRATPTDISTAKGRKEVASLAFKVARSKTALDEMGKSLVSGLKAQSKLIDAERAKVWDRLEALQAEVRKPLDDYEAAEAARVAAHHNAMQDIVDLGSFDVDLPASALVIERLANLDALPARDWQEFKDRAVGCRGETFAKLIALKEAALKREADIAEIERLRAEQAARDQREREERIAAEAAAKATREAEEKAEREAKAAAAFAEAERLRAERLRVEAVERAERIEREAREAADKAERDRVAAAAQAERDRLAAIEAERQRVADAEAAEAAEKTRREADKAHRKAINSEALAAFVAAGLTVEQGMVAIAAIVRGQIPNIHISY